jgi:hypothetical protein
MTRQEHRPPPVTEPADETPHLGDPCGVEAVRRFIEDQQLGILEQRRRDAETLFHPLRIGGETILGSIGEADLFQNRFDALPRCAGMMCEDAQVVPARQARVEAG